MDQTLTPPPPSRLPSILGVVAETFRATAWQNVLRRGIVAYAMIWLSFPVFNVLINALIYRDAPALRNYGIIGGAMLAFLFAMLFNAGEILDRERQRATLSNLFLAPCPRYAWLGGMQLFSLAEAGMAAIVALMAGWAIFGLPIDINAPALILTLLLFIPCLWGFSMAFGAVGVAIRGANMLSNFVFPFLIMLSGAMYPVGALPTWLRIPARMLPFGYGIHAIVQVTTRRASVAALASDLLPLLAFAIALPLIGIAMFTRLEHRARRTGELDLL